MANGAPISREEAVVTHLRGYGFSNLRMTYQAMMTEEVWHRFLGTLEPRLAELLLHPVGPEVWVSFELVMALRAEVIRATSLRGSSQRGRMTAQSLVEKGASPFPIQPGNLEDTLTHLPELVTYSHKGGLMTLDQLIPCRAQYSYWGIFPYPEYPSEFGVGFFEQLLLLQGAKNPHVGYIPPEGDDFRHRYLFHWEGGLTG
jgi:hypothetical protein